MDNGVKVFQLTPEVVKVQLMPGKEMYAWGYSGSVPGPTVEVNEGDRVRVVESRPLSRTKRWRLVEVLERAK